jgi:uncharacterized membrane protein YfcA
MMTGQLNHESASEECALITDPWFYAAAVPAVLIFAISKGGFGGGLGIVSVPLMALVISPIQAAAVMLPILCVMDLFALKRYQGRWSGEDIRLLVPASLVGIVVGTLLFGTMSTAAVRLIVGLVAIAFTLMYWFRPRLDAAHRDPPRALGVVGGALAGFTSFVAHAGGPPVNMYLLRRSLDRTCFVATVALFFAVVNYVKLLPYGWLGQFDAANLMTSLVLLPLAPIGIEVGYRLHLKVSDRQFYHIVYVLLFGVGAHLVYDGIMGL